MDIKLTGKKKIITANFGFLKQKNWDKYLL